MTGDYEELRFLVGSPNRVQILELLDNRTLDIRDLRDELDIPRTTLQKNIRELEEKKWIHRTKDSGGNAGYTTTTLGNIIMSEFRRCRDIMYSATELEPFLRWIPKNVLEPDIRHLKDSNITTPEPPNPRAPERRLVELVNNSSTIRLFSPILTPMMVDELNQGFNEGDLEGEAVLEREVIEVLQEEYSDIVRRAEENPSIKLKMYDGELPFVLVILDEYVVYAGVDEDGVTRALLTNDSSTAVNHAEQMYGSYAEEAEQIL